MTWSKLSDLLTVRSHHTACLVGEHIIITGGLDESERQLKSTECYNIKENVWYKAADFLRPDVDLFVFGEVTVWSLEVQEVMHLWDKLVIMTSRQTNDMMSFRLSHCMACVKDRLYVIGGFSAFKIEMYDHDFGQFTIIGRDVWIPMTRTNAVVVGTKIYMVGKKLETYNVMNNKLATKDAGIPSYIQAQLALIHLTVLSLKEICCSKILNVLEHHRTKCPVYEKIDALQLPIILKEELQNRIKFNCSSRSAN